MANITMNNCRDLSNIKSQIPIIGLEENNSVQNLPKDPHKNIKIIKIK